MQLVSRRSTWQRSEHGAASLYPVTVIGTAVVASAVLITIIALLSGQSESQLRYTFDFEGGRRGSEIKTSDTGSGEPFDTVFEDEVTNTATYGDAFTADGVLSGRFTFDDGDDPFSALGWDLPAASEYFIRVVGRIDDAGDVFRFDMHVVADPEDGLVEARIWRNEISDSDPYEEIGATGLDTGTGWDNAFFSLGSHTDDRVVVSIDALEVNDLEWPNFTGS